MSDSYGYISEGFTTESHQLSGCYEASGILIIGSIFCIVYIPVNI